jgi:hypothetical protein
MRAAQIAASAAAVTSLAILTTSLSFGQSAAESGEGKKPPENKTKLVDFHVKLSTKDGKRVPVGTTVEITGKSAACGSFLGKDDSRPVDGDGEVVFHVPACKVSVKTDPDGYKQVPKPKEVDLAKDKPSIELVLQPES